MTKLAMNDQILNLETVFLKKNKIMHGFLVVWARCKSETFESFIQLETQLVVFFYHYLEDLPEAFLFNSWWTVFLLNFFKTLCWKQQSPSVYLFSHILI